MSTTDVLNWIRKEETNAKRAVHTKCIKSILLCKLDEVKVNTKKNKDKKYLLNLITSYLDQNGESRTEGDGGNDYGGSTREHPQTSEL